MCVNKISGVQGTQKTDGPETISGTLLKRSGSNTNLNTVQKPTSTSGTQALMSKSNEELDKDLKSITDGSLNKSKISSDIKMVFSTPLGTKPSVNTNLPEIHPMPKLPDLPSIPEKVDSLPNIDVPKTNSSTKDTLTEISGKSKKLTMVQIQDNKCLTANKPQIKADNVTNKFSAANKEDQIAIINAFKINPAFNQKFKTAVKNLDSTMGVTESQRNAKKEVVYQNVEKDFKQAILSLPPNGKTIQNLSMLSKSELTQAILPFVVDMKTKYTGIDDINKLPENKQKLIASIVNGIHDAFPNKATGISLVDTKNHGQIEVPSSIKVKGVEYNNPVHVASGGLGHALRYTDPNGKSVIVKQLIMEKVPESSPDDDKMAKSIRESIIKENLAKRNEMITEFKGHLNALGDTGHKNIVGLKGMAIGEDDSLYMVMDEAKGGGMDKLANNINTNTSISDKTKEILQKGVLKDVMSGVAHMQDKGIKHLDIKDENFFVHEDGTAVLGDFGTSRTDNFVSKGFETTPDYKSPEILSDDKIVSKESDTWAVGMTAYKLIEGNSSRFYNNKESQVNWYNELNEFPKDVNNRVFSSGDQLRVNADKKIDAINNEIPGINKKIEEKESAFKIELAKFTDFPAVDTRMDDIMAIINKANEDVSTATLEITPFRRNNDSTSPEFGLAKQKLELAENNKLEIDKKFAPLTNAKSQFNSAQNELSNIPIRIKKVEDRFDQLTVNAKKDKLEPKHEIINALMHPDPTKRPDVKDVLKHSYFNDNRLESLEMKELKKELVKKPEHQDQNKIKQLSDALDKL